MSSQLYYPILNPLQAVDVTPAQDTTVYATRHIDDFLYSDQIYRFQNKIPFLQPFVSKDPLRIQVESNYAPIRMDLEDQYGRIQTGFSVTMTQARANKYQPGFYVYEANISLQGLGCGPWRYRITPAGDVTKQLKTEWFQIINDPYGTIAIDYYNSSYHGDVIFETGIQFRLRVPGFIVYNDPGTKLVAYENQPLNQTIVSARKFRQATFFLGDGSGVPPWMMDKVAASYTCDNWSLDLKPFAIVDGKVTVNNDPDMLLAGYNFNIREGLNRQSKIVSGDQDPNKKITIIYNIDGRLFSDVSANAGETVIQILGQQ